MSSVLFAFGTRSEALKLAPVIHEAAQHADWEVRTCSTGEDEDQLAQVLGPLRSHLDWEVGVVDPEDDLSTTLARCLEAVGTVLAQERPSLVVAQGGAATGVAVALAALHAGCPFAHVGAGFRGSSLPTPFPAEAHRAVVSRLASLHFAPTATAYEALLEEGVPPARIRVTGSTSIDALRRAVPHLPDDGAPPTAVLDRWSEPRRVVMVTGHGGKGGLPQLCGALSLLAHRYPNVDWVFPQDESASVRAEVRDCLGGHHNVHLLAPLDYAASLWLMRRARFIVTDSGGIQDEAPEFGKPVLVTRVATDRPETLAAGTAVLVGDDADRLVHWAKRWLEDDAAYALARPRANPFGDGLAAVRVVAALREWLGLPVGSQVRPWAVLEPLAA